MAAIESASFSDMSRDGRHDVLRKYRGVLGGDVKAARATEGDLAALGIPVEHVGADGLPAPREATGIDGGVTDER